MANILAVDDVPDVLSTIKSMLKGKYNIYGFTKHTDALRFLGLKHADLMLLDIEMPDMDGFALLEEIRKIEKYKETPVLFLTGNTDASYVEKALAAGAKDYIKKPVHMETLLEIVSKYIV